MIKKKYILTIITIFAISYFALSIKSDNAFVEYQKGKDLFDKSDFVSAIIPLSNSIKIDSSFAEAYNLRGICFYKIGIYPEALEDFSKSLEIYLIKYQLLKLSNKGNSEEIQLNQSISNSYFNRALVFQESGDYPKALNDYNFVIENDHTNKFAYFNKGYIYNELGNKDSAISCFTSALIIDSNDIDANYNLATIYYNNKSYRKAIYVYTKLIELGMANEETLVNLANCYFNQNEYEKAITQYDIAIKINKTNPSIYFNRGKAYNALGDNKAAIQDYNNFIKFAAKDSIYKSYIPSVQQEIDYIQFKSKSK